MAAGGVATERGDMYEAVEFSESQPVPGEPAVTAERVLGVFEVEADAVAVGRAARGAYDARGETGYSWWVVREQGAQFARWIADSRNDREFVLDLRTGELTEV